MNIEAFEPYIKQDTGAIASKRIAVTAAAASTLISDLNGEMLRLNNIGAEICYVTFHKNPTAPIPATNAAHAIGSGQCEVIKRPCGACYISVIGDGATVLNIVAGIGL